MTDIPKAVWSGSFLLFGVEMKCHVLEDGRGIIEADSMAQFLEALECGGADPGDVVGFANWQRGKQ